MIIQGLEKIAMNFHFLLYRKKKSKFTLMKSIIMQQIPVSGLNPMLMGTKQLLQQLEPQQGSNPELLMMRLQPLKLQP